MKIGDIVIPKKPKSHGDSYCVFLDPNEDPITDEPNLPILWDKEIIGTIIDIVPFQENDDFFHETVWVKVMISKGVGYCFGSEIEIVNTIED